MALELSELPLHQSGAPVSFPDCRPSPPLSEYRPAAFCRNTLPTVPRGMPVSISAPSGANNLSRAFWLGSALPHNTPRGMICSTPRVGGRTLPAELESTWPSTKLLCGGMMAVLTPRKLESRWPGGPRILDAASARGDGCRCREERDGYRNRRRERLREGDGDGDGDGERLLEGDGDGDGDGH